MTPDTRWLAEVREALVEVRRELYAQRREREREEDQQRLFDMLNRTYGYPRPRLPRRRRRWW